MPALMLPMLTMAPTGRSGRPVRSAVRPAFAGEWKVMANALIPKRKFGTRLADRKEAPADLHTAG
jgi:hypothetical protein